MVRLEGVAVAQAGASLSLVIPVYNEQGILAETVAAVVDAVRSDDAVGRLEVIVSENGSRDGTRAVARELAARFEEVILLESDVADYGAAMREGFLAAGGDFVVNFDADYYDVAFLRQALDVDADVVIAAKGIAGSVDARALLRRVVSRGFGLVVRRLLGVRTSETHGMKLFRRAAIEPLLPQVDATKDLFDTELVARAEKSGLAIVELPIVTAEMRHSRSAIVRRIPRTVWGLVRMRRRLRREHRADPASAAAAEKPSPWLAAVQHDAVLGTCLYPVGPAGMAIRGVEDGFVARDEAGVAVVVVVLEAATVGTGAQIADELDRLAALGSDQPAVLLVREPPDPTAWQELTVELGGRLGGVWAIDGDTLVPLEAPDEADARPPWLGRAGLAARVLLLLGGLLVLAVAGTRVGPEEAPVAPSVVHDVATGVPMAATHGQWLGQDRLVRTSEGTVLAVYGSEQGLQVMADAGGDGRTWRPLASLPEVAATSSSLVVDDADRLHVAFSDGTRVGYTVVAQRDGRWTAVELDGDAPRVRESSRLAPPATQVPVLVNVAAGRNDEVVATYRRGDAAVGWFARTLTGGADRDLVWGPEEALPTDAGIGAADFLVDQAGVITP